MLLPATYEVTVGVAGRRPPRGPGPAGHDLRPRHRRAGRGGDGGHGLQPGDQDLGLQGQPELTDRRALVGQLLPDPVREVHRDEHRCRQCGTGTWTGRTACAGEPVAVDPVDVVGVRVVPQRRPLQVPRQPAGPNDDDAPRAALGQPGLRVVMMRLSRRRRRGALPPSRPSSSRRSSSCSSSASWSSPCSSRTTCRRRTRSRRGCGWPRPKARVGNFAQDAADRVETAGRRAQRATRAAVGLQGQHHQ